MSSFPDGAHEASSNDEIEAQRADAEARHRRGTRQLLAARAVFMVLSYVTSVLLARWLGPANFGVLGILLATLLWLEMVSWIGVPGAMSRLIPSDIGAADTVERSARFLLVLTSLGVFAIAWVVAPLLASVFHLSDGTRLVRIAILDIPVAAMYTAYRGALTGRRQFGTLGVSQALWGGAKLAGVMALLLVGVSVANALLANVAATCVALAYLLVRHPPKAFRPSREIVRRIISIGLPMGAFAIGLQILTSLDLWFLGGLWQGPEGVVGNYVAALKVAQALIVIPMVQSGVVLASVAWALSSEDRVGARRHILEASRFTLIITVAACVILGGSAPSLMAVIYSSRFAEGGRFLVIQLLAFTAFGFMDIYANALMAAGHQRRAAGVVVGFVPVVAAANLLLIPWLGPMGAALSLLLGMLGVAVTIALLVWREFGPPLAAPTFLRVGVAAVLVGIPAVLLRVSGPLVLLKILVLTVAYLLVLYASGEISMDDFTLPSAALSSETTA